MVIGVVGLERIAGAAAHLPLLGEVLVDPHFRQRAEAFVDTIIRRATDNQCVGVGGPIAAINAGEGMHLAVAHGQQVIAIAQAIQPLIGMPTARLRM